MLPDDKIQGLFKACFSNSYESLDGTVQVRGDLLSLIVVLCMFRISLLTAIQLHK